ncbi:MAG TPA: DmsC/YnfH family molybdoenzyme membrane anchor subunit [Lysobacter sp.]|nr:DmsC/YnfH family molybdoenzyme membrane anchor subunit [Lysobacter sp.]
MHPAFSVIFFTTLSGAGYGLWCWAGFGAIAAMPARVLLVALGLGALLVTAGLLSSLAHLGKPARAWRAFSQWRTSWLSREGVMAVLCYLPAVALALALLPGMLDGSGNGRASLGTAGIAAAALLVACALLTVACTAMIYASLPPIPAWRHRLVVPAYLLFALMTGGVLFATLAGALGGLSNLAGLGILVGALALYLLKRRYWRDIDRGELPATRGDAVGLPERTLRVFERPHTEANFVTREMGYVLARKHSKRLRAVASLLFALVPALCALPVWVFVHLDAEMVLLPAAISVLLGALVERWLFFAEARHVVMLYY